MASCLPVPGTLPQGVTATHPWGACKQQQQQLGARRQPYNQMCGARKGTL